MQHEAAGGAVYRTTSSCSNDELIASMIAEEEARLHQQRAGGGGAGGAAASSPPLPQAPEGSQELALLAREQSAYLSVMPRCLDESPLTRTLTSSLTQLHGVSFTRLVPRRNSVAAAADAAPEPPAAHRRRLEARLSLYALVERTVAGDGNCQFRALSDQLYRSPDLHGFVRECVVSQLWYHAPLYAEFVPGEDYGAYVAGVARAGTWGDHITLQAAADYFGLRVRVLTSYRGDDACFLEIEPRALRSERELWLSFWAELHYNSVYPAADAPPAPPPERLLGSRRLWQLVFGGGA